MTEHIVAVFSESAEADAAERELKEAGVPAGSIRRYTGNERELASASGPAGGQTAEPSGFWAWLLGEETTSSATSDEHRADARAFDSRVSSGNPVVSVTLNDDAQIHRTIELLEAHHPIGIDETTDEDQQPVATTGMGATRETATGTAREARAEGRDEVIPLAKEELEIGKQQIDRGTTRVRRYVVETPVERDVQLHGERVTVERRRPTGATQAGEGQFEERVVEVHERDEQPVVQKKASVGEEVVIRREPTERTERVRETVRREEVEITPQSERKPQR